MTYNIRGYVPCDTFKTPSHHWYYRQKHIIDIIKKENPDILAVQEVFNIPSKAYVICKQKPYIMGYIYDSLIHKDIQEVSKQGINISPPKHLIRDFMREKLKKLGYLSYYQPSGSPKIIFYKKNKFKFMLGGQFYQNKKKSTTYLLLKTKLNNPILIVNTHLYSGKKYQKLRTKSIQYIIEKLKKLQLTKYPILFVGDFNINSLSKEYKLLTSLLSTQLNLISINNIQNNYTFHNFGTTKKTIDYIFFSPTLKLISSQSIPLVFNLKEKKLIPYTQKNKNILFPSDHWPLINYFKLK